MASNPQTCKPSDAEIRREAEALLIKWGATEIKHRTRRRHIDLIATCRGLTVTTRIPVTTVRRKKLPDCTIAAAMR